VLQPVRQQCTVMGGDPSVGHNIQPTDPLQCRCRSPPQTEAPWSLLAQCLVAALAKHTQNASLHPSTANHMSHVTYTPPKKSRMPTNECCTDSCGLHQQLQLTRRGTLTPTRLLAGHHNGHNPGDKRCKAQSSCFKPGAPRHSVFPCARRPLHTQQMRRCIPRVCYNYIPAALQPAPVHYHRCNQLAVPSTAVTTP